MLCPEALGRTPGADDPSLPRTPLLTGLAGRENGIAAPPVAKPCQRGGQKRAGGSAGAMAAPEVLTPSTPQPVSHMGHIRASWALRCLVRAGPTVDRAKHQQTGPLWRVGRTPTTRVPLLLIDPGGLSPEIRARAYLQDSAESHAHPGHLPAAPATLRLRRPPPEPANAAPAWPKTRRPGC